MTSKKATGGRPALDLHVYPSDMRFESRIGRITSYLQRLGYFSKVELVGANDGTQVFDEVLEDGRSVKLFSILPFLRRGGRVARIGAFLFWYVNVLRYYLFQRISCVNAHSLSVLPLCWFLAGLKRCALVYEPHELETETASSPQFAKGFLRWLEGTLARRCDRVIVVADGIAEWYRDTLHIDDIWVIRNLPTAVPTKTLEQDYYHKLYGIPATALIFIYQGILAQGRGIELLIESFRKVPKDRHLILLGYGDYEDVVRKASETDVNIHFHPAVAVGDLLQYSGAADVGLMMIEDVSLSYYYCYPNKYCEYLSAGIPVVLSDFLWVLREVEEYTSGWAASLDSDGLARVVGDIDRVAIDRKRSGARRWRDENSWSAEEVKIQKIYSGLFSVGVVGSRDRLKAGAQGEVG